MILEIALLMQAAPVPPNPDWNCEDPTYQQEMDKLETECRDRGGILSPTGGQTGRPQTDYACKITGVATRIPQG